MFKGGKKMARCDQMKRGEVYGCQKCEFEFQVLKECVHQEEVETGACATEMNCCGEELKLMGHGTGEPQGTGRPFPGQPVMGSGG